MHERMAEKGWNQEEIDGTMSKLYDPEKVQKHSHHQHHLNPIIYWAVLIVAIIGNFILAFIFIPFMMMLNQNQLMIMFGVSGLIFGAMFNVLLKDIEKIDYQHHVMAGIFIPAIAAITVFVMVSIANNFSKLIDINVIQNPILISVVYVIAFSLPYFIYKIKDLSKPGKKYEKPKKEVSQNKTIIQSGIYSNRY